MTVRHTSVTSHKIWIYEILWSFWNFPFNRKLWDIVIIQLNQSDQTDQSGYTSASSDRFRSCFIQLVDCITSMRFANVYHQPIFRYDVFSHWLQLKVNTRQEVFCQRETSIHFQIWSSFHNGCNWRLSKSKRCHREKGSWQPITAIQLVDWSEIMCDFKKWLTVDNSYACCHRCKASQIMVVIKRQDYVIDRRGQLATAIQLLDHHWTAAVIALLRR